MESEKAVRRAIGRADSCELLSYLFAYPDERLVNGLVDGTAAEDARSCLLDAGVAEDSAATIAEGMSAWKGASAAKLLSQMRVTYSRLYLAPGGRTPIQPFESSFLHVERELPGVPSLFRTSVTMDVERCMREAGVAAKDSRKEPCDSVFKEFEFLSFLHAKLAEAYGCGNDEDVEVWTARIRTFEDAHVFEWLPSFMRRTQELDSDGPYAAFANFALCAMGDRS